MRTSEVARDGARSSQEVRQLLLHAARTLFARHGYGGTTTRAIAKAAGVAEVMLFRHFGSKASIYQESVIEPLKTGFAEIIAELAQQGYGARPHDPERSAVYYVDHVFGFLHNHRDSLLAVLASGESADGAGVPQAAEMFRSLFDQLERDVEVEARAHGWDHLDVPMATRITFGIVTSMTLLDGWFFDDGAGRPDRDRVARAMAQYMIHGMAHRPTAEPEAAGSPPTRDRHHGSVSATVRAPVAVLTLDGPANGNALGLATTSDVVDEIGRLQEIPEVRAIVLTGAGASFCSGADPDEPAPDLAALAAALRGCSVPVVAAVGGPAIGLGCALAGLCDVVVIGESAYLAETHLAFEAIGQDPCASPFAAGLLRAKRQLLTGARVDARTAHDLGLAQEIAPDDAVAATAHDLAVALARSATGALAMTRGPHGRAPGRSGG